MNMAYQIPSTLMCSMGMRTATAAALQLTSHSACRSSSLPLTLINGSGTGNFTFLSFEETDTGNRFIKHLSMPDASFRIREAL